jgi:hypothetical protein
VAAPWTRLSERFRAAIKRVAARYGTMGRGRS